MSKKYYIFAGVNGAGKSTLYKSDYLSEGIKELPYINADNILRTFSDDWKSAENQMKSGRMAIKERNRLIKEEESFCQETTLTGKGILNSLKKIKDLGYQINMYYVGVDDPNISLERIKNRVSKGGHGIDEEVVRRRYDNSLDNLKEAFKICDNITIYDNTKNFTKIAWFEKGDLVFYKNKNNVSWLENTLGADLLKTQKEQAIKRNKRKKKARNLENEIER